MWRQEPGEVPPNYPETAKTEIARVYVAIARLAADNEDEKGQHSKAQPMLPNSYEFVMVHREDDGTLDLPGTDVLPNESLREAVERVLASIKVKTWSHPDFVEPLYTAYTPRGRLATVMFVPVWGMVDEKTFEDGLNWRHAPLSMRATAMGGFYKAMESVWAMRLYHHFRTADHTEAICVKVSGMGSSYFELERLLREGKPNLDTSMAELMRRQMSEDEKFIAKRLAKHAEMVATLKDEKDETLAEASESIELDLNHEALDFSSKQLVARASHGAEDFTDREVSGLQADDLGRADEKDSAEFVELDPPAEVSDDDNSADEAPQDDVVVEVVPGVPKEGYVRLGRPLSMKLP
jgi:hypothetical protein